MLRIYKRVLEKHPFLTQAVQTGFLMGAGDVIAQMTLEKKNIQSLELKRTATFTAIGVFYIGPGLRLWYGALQRLFGSGGQPKQVLKKVALDQFVFAPALLASILTVVPLASGQSLQQAQAKLGQDYWAVLKGNYYLWPWVQLANFYWVPLQYQVLVVQVVALFWNVFVSWKANAPIESKLLQIKDC